ncbi:hypothetical protein GCM10007304_17690 [Rhodococcoides trifolii]|uniref:RHS repeat protein n=1 Tax=Rhodococcoides trifolii TaxID=908250 RepID=A0A917FVB4_9NOCA|nr:RHS repeat domain-containing protein [Rhodococcus trifolii]GGG04018.1 hypothetical protein GCM10007304_17690 [Rhodococcus trifolii]
MSVVFSANFKDIGLGPVQGKVKFAVRTMRMASDGSQTAIVGPVVRANVVNGVMEPKTLDGGLMRVWIEIIGYTEGPLDIEAPTTGTAPLLPLLLAARVNPATGQSVILAAIASYFQTNPPTGGSTSNSTVANFVTSNGATKTALDASYAPALAPATDYTWDSATGSIKTITEHYPAPIGDRVTTYAAYNSVGDPTTETDPSGQVWNLGYDSNGNLSTRTKVA